MTAPLNNFQRRHERDLRITAERRVSEETLSRVLVRALSGLPAGDAAQAHLERVMQGERFLSAFESLNATQQSALRTAFDSRDFQQILSLARESDRDFFFEALFHFARRQIGEGRDELGARLYAGIAEIAPEDSIRERARSQLQILLGGGSAGDRFQFQLSRLLPEALEPSSLIAMGVAGGLFRATRVFALSRFMANPGLLTRLVGPTTLAGLSAFGVEAAAFPLTRRLAAEAMGRPQNWSGDAMASDVISSAMFLGGLRLFGAVGDRAYRSLGGNSQWARSLFTQGSQWTGIMAGQWMERRLHSHESAHPVLDSLAMLLQFHIAGNIVHQAFGEGFRSWETELELRNQILSAKNSPPNWPDLGLGWGAQYAVSGVGAIPGRNLPLEDLVTRPLAMMSRGSGRGGARDRESPEEAKTREEQVLAFLESNPTDHVAGLRKFLEGFKEEGAVVARMDARKGGDFGRIFMINPRFREMFGHDENGISQIPIRKIFHPFDVLGIAPRLWLIIRGGVFPPTRFRMLCEDGSYRAIIGSGVIKEVYGQTLGFGFFRDPTGLPEEDKAQNPMIEMLGASHSVGKSRPNRDGVIELQTFLEFNLQLTQPDSELLQRLSKEDLNIRLTSGGYISDPTHQAGPLLRFLNSPLRKLDFPLGRRLSIELPERPGEPRRSLDLMKYSEGFRIHGAQGREEGDAPALASRRSTGTHKTPPVPAGSPGTPPPPSPRGTTGRMKAPEIATDPPPSPPRTPGRGASGTYNRVMAALAGRPIPGNESFDGNGEGGLQKKLKTEMWEGFAPQQFDMQHRDIEVTLGLYPATFMEESISTLHAELKSFAQMVQVPRGRKIAFTFTSSDGETHRWVFQRGAVDFERIDPP